MGMGHGIGEARFMLVKVGHRAYRCLQGCGVQVFPAEAGSRKFSTALSEVLTHARYTKAAQALSRKLRARKNTPVEEAAGAAVHLHQAINLHTCSCSPLRVIECCLSS